MTPLLVDIMRRIVVTSGLLFMPAVGVTDLQSACFLAIMLNIGFATLYREAVS